MEQELERYSIITEKNPREIVLLRGKGCAFRKCRFCDYHTDFSTDQSANYQLNNSVLSMVTGQFHRLEVINSGSYVDLDSDTIQLIKDICIAKRIKDIHFESHWMHRDSVAALKQEFQHLGVTVHVKIGVESFDYLFRESYLIKGIPDVKPEEIAAYFDDVCLLQGLPGQSVEFMERDIETGLTYFDRVCINIMVENKTLIKPDPRTIRAFVDELMPRYIDNPRVDILLHNTDFGVGGEKHVNK